MKTESLLTFGLVDVTAKPDASMSSNDKQPFCSPNDLRNEFDVYKYGTLEKNYYLLDGSFETFPDTIKYSCGYWSKALSDPYGILKVQVELSVSFTQQHSSNGVSIKFNELTDDYCNHISVEWYRANILLHSMTAHPTGTVHFVECKQEKYDKIKIMFHRTNRPFRYVKVTELDFGEIKVLDKSSILEANIIEEINPLSSEIAINKLDVRLYSHAAEFNILNPRGIYAQLQELQPLKIYKKTDKDKKYMGTYYLETWENDTYNTINLSAVDVIGVMDKTRYMGGLYVNTSAIIIINDIMQSVQVDYTLDSDVANMPLNGYIPVCTHREALQQIAFALGLIVDTSRGSTIRMYKANTNVISNIGKDRKFMGQKLRLKPLVTGVELTAHNYVKSTSIIELFKGNLTQGKHRLIFDSPAHDVTVTGASIVTAATNYIDVNVISAGQIIAQGQGYKDNKQIFGVNREVKVEEKANVLKVDSAMLLSSDRALETAQRIYEYYQNRYESENSIQLLNEKVGDMISIDNDYNNKLIGIIESIDINASGGFIANVKTIGVIRQGVG